MYELGVRRRFAAAHRLRGYQGKCEALHGHTYQVEVCVQAEKLDQLGLALDFKKLKTLVNQVLERYDHGFINELEPFDQVNPSAENLARVISERLEHDLPANVTLARVVVWESEDAWAAYYSDRT